MVSRIAAVLSSPSTVSRSALLHPAMSPAPTRTAISGVTVIVAWPVFPSLVAVIVALPTATPPTSPLVSTVATAASLVPHVTERPVSGLPAVSLGEAVSFSVPFTWTVATAGATSTLLTGIFVTVMAEVPLFPSEVAVSVTGPPAAFPVTRPLASTLASVVSALCHVTARPVSGLPTASLGVAASCTVPFTRMLADAGVTSTELTAICV